MGRPFETDPKEIVAWRTANRASIAQTAAHFGISIATVKRAAKVSAQADAVGHGRHVEGIPVL